MKQELFERFKIYLTHKKNNQKTNRIASKSQQFTTPYGIEHRVETKSSNHTFKIGRDYSLPNNRKYDLKSENFSNGTNVHNKWYLDIAWMRRKKWYLDIVWEYHTYTKLTDTNICYISTHNLWTGVLLFFQCIILKSFCTFTLSILHYWKHGYISYLFYQNTVIQVTCFITLFMVYAYENVFFFSSLINVVDLDSRLFFLITFFFIVCIHRDSAVDPGFDKTRGGQGFEAYGLLFTILYT